MKNRREWAAKQLDIRGRIPRVEPVIFRSAPDLGSALDEIQRTRVFGRNDVDSGPPWTWRDLLAEPPQRDLGRVTPEFSGHVLPELMRKIGIQASTAHLRFGGDWTLQPVTSGTRAAVM